MAIKTSLTVPGFSLGAAYVLVSDVSIHHLLGTISYNIAGFRDAATRKAFGGAVAAVTAASMALDAARQDMARAEAIPMPEVSPGKSQVLAQRDRTNAIEAARRSTLDCMAVRDNTLGEMNDPAIQPCKQWTGEILPAGVAGPLLSAAGDQIKAAIYAELKKPGGLLANGTDA